MLYKDKVVSDTIPILVETKGWQALAYYFNQLYTTRLYPVPFRNKHQKDCFHPTSKELSAAGIDTSKIIVVRMDNFRPTGVDGDNFILHTAVKNTDQWSGVRCNSIFLHIVGRNGSVQMRFTNPGCSYWINCKLSEKTINRNDEDLSNFVFDITE